MLYFGGIGGFHFGAWRLPGVDGDVRSAFEIYKRCAQLAERGKMHGFFVLDRLWLDPSLGRKPSGSMLTPLEPLTLMAALSQATERVGFIATRNTTYDEPYHVAREFATLDHISGGRAGWNVVTGPGKEAPNFNADAQLEHDRRYERAEEFVDVVRELWDSWEDDAFVYDKGSGTFWDPERVHPIEHAGRHLQVEGALNVIRPPQGHPVLAQAGTSPAGRALAARIGELIFAIPQTMGDATRVRAELRALAEGFGRDPDHLKYLPDLHLLLAPTQTEAEERLGSLDAYADPLDSLPELSRLVGVDLGEYPLDGLLPDEIPQTEGFQTWQQHYVSLARSERLTIRQLAIRFAQFPSPVIAGTPESVADRMEEWLTTGAADGFMLRPSQLRALDDFVELLVPELQRRGIYHSEYEGTTLRENLGIPRPPGRQARRSRSTVMVGEATS
jgi:alkanesulfonate monooxygenase